MPCCVTIWKVQKKVSITAIDPTGRIVRTFINSGVRKPGPQQETLSFGGSLADDTK